VWHAERVIVTRRSCIGVVAAIAIIAGGTLPVRASSTTVEGKRVTLSGRIGRCSQSQSVEDPAVCARLARSPKLYLVGPYSAATTQPNVGRRVISGDMNRRFAVSVPAGKYVLKIDVEGVLYWASGIAGETFLWLPASRTGLDIRPESLFPSAGTVAEN
jgi:hypothetical protein